MKRTIRFLSYLTLPLLYLFTTDVFAGVFDPPPTDKSVEFLGLIFGSNIGTIYLGGTSNPVLSAIFEKLNIIIVAIGTGIVSYIGIVSTINTAQEGQTMGRKWSSIWLPMRSIMGMLLMVPTPGSGYSMIQVTVVWIILQGIGAADQIWEIILDNLSQGISATSSNISNQDTALDTTGETVVKSLLNSVICLESIKEIASGQAIDDSDPPQPLTPEDDFINKYGSVVRIYQTAPTVTINNTSIPNSVTYEAYLKMGAKNPNETGDKKRIYEEMCGSFKVNATVTIGDPSKPAEENETSNELANLQLTGQSLIAEAAQRAENAMNIKFLALNTVSNVLKPAARSITHDRKILSNDYLFVARDSYREPLKNLIKPAKTTDAIQIAVDTGKRAGWIAAGSYYFVLNSTITQSLLATATIAPTVTPFSDDINSIPTCTDDDCQDGRDSFYTTQESLAGLLDYVDPSVRSYIAKRLYAGYNYSDNGFKTTTAPVNLNLTDGGTGINQFLQILLHPLQELTASIIKALGSLMTGDANEDPLLKIASFGSWLMLITEIALLVITVACTNFAAAAGIMAWASPGFMIAIALFTTIVPIIITIVGSIWLCGATLSIYVPMVPYMIYTVTALGWLLLVIEAVVAAPIVALGFVIPSGEELGKVVPGLMLLIGIILRPTLMLFGFLLGARLFRAIVALVNFGIGETLSTLPMKSILSPLICIFLYGGFIIALVNKCFALIYLLPDKILMWIGGPAGQTDTSAIQETKQGFDKAAHEAKGVGSGAASGATTAAGKSVDRGAEQAAQSQQSQASEAKQDARFDKLAKDIKKPSGDAVT